MSENTNNSVNSSPEYKKMLGMIGMAKRSGNLVSGVPIVISEIRSDKQRPKIGIVLLSGGCSKNTEKQMTNSCTYYKVPMRKIEVSPSDLGHAIGKMGEVCAVAVKGDRGIIESVIKKIDDFEQSKYPEPL